MRLQHIAFVALTTAIAALAVGVLSVPSTARGEMTVVALAKETHFHGIAVDAADSARVYLATHHGLYVAGSDGKVERISEIRDYMGFTAHPTDAAILFASGHPASGGNLGLIVSKDGGRSWTNLSNGIGGPVDFHQMDVSKADPRIIYGVFGSLQRSADGGQSWERLGPAPSGIISLATSSIDANTIYAATRSGLQRSMDGGRSWKVESDRTATMVHVTRDGTVYAFMVGTGLVRAAERNLAWRVVGEGFGDDFILHFAADSQDRQRLYAVTYNPRTAAQSVIASRNGGERWFRLGSE